MTPAWVMPGAQSLIGLLPTRDGAPPYGTRPLADIDAMVIHFTGDPTPGGSVKGYDPWPSIFATATYQTTKKDGDLFPAFAYHFEATPAGDLFQAHALEARTWHAGALGNQTGIGVHLPGYGIKGWPAPLQIALVASLKNRAELYLRRPIKVRPHKHYGQTACCGENSWAICHAIEQEAIRQMLDLDLIEGQLNGAWTARETIMKANGELRSPVLENVAAALFDCVTKIKAEIAKARG